MQKIIKLLNISGFLLVMLTIVNTGCKKLVEVESPVTNLSTLNVYTSDATAISAMTGIYATLSRSENEILNFFDGLTAIPIIAGLSADELTLFELTSTSLCSLLQKCINTNIN